jgi:hypothetical protein
MSIDGIDRAAAGGLPELPGAMAGLTAAGGVVPVAKGAPGRAGGAAGSAAVASVGVPGGRSGPRVPGKDFGGGFGR